MIVTLKKNYIKNIVKDSGASPELFENLPQIIGINYVIFNINKNADLIKYCFIELPCECKISSETKITILIYCVGLSIIDTFDLDHLFIYNKLKHYLQTILML